ncbi:uncharacterized protein L203_100506 [Cryptococcus depauperatus CBS 7841]|uniref:Uncharacterized protein n=1 Tax=Cryptococcus depauperatus CBS 7841 TaxID=1295531 RepID=A0AAJ8JN86_9TREE
MVITVHQLGLERLGKVLIRAWLKGAAISFGRSTVYRFTAIVTVSTMAIADCEPPAHLNGVISKPHTQTLLLLGYKYDCMNMIENYNGPGSPYRCMKAFICLASLAHHPFWTAEELPWPNDLFLSHESPSDLLHLMCRQGGHIFLLPSSQSPHYAMHHGPARYCKFSYSSIFGFSCPTGNMDLGQLVESQIWYLRVHKISPKRKLPSSERGWAVHGQGADGRALVRNFSGPMSAGGDQEISWVRTVTAGGAVGLFDIPCRGSFGKREGQLIQAGPNSNVIFSRSILLSLLDEIEPSESWLATAIIGKPPVNNASQGW